MHANVWVSVSMQILSHQIPLYSNKKPKCLSMQHSGVYYFTRFTCPGTTPHILWGNFSHPPVSWSWSTLFGTLSCTNHSPQDPCALSSYLGPCLCIGILFRSSVTRQRNGFVSTVFNWKHIRSLHAFLFDSRGETVVSKRALKKDYTERKTLSYNPWFRVWFDGLGNAII